MERRPLEPAARPAVAGSPAAQPALPSAGSAVRSPGVPIATDLPAEAARDLAARLLGSPVTAAEQVPSSAGSQVFRIQANGSAFFLKLGDGPDLRRELGALELAGSLGVPVPVIEAADPAGDSAGVGCALLRKAGGRPCSSASPEFAAAGPLLRRLHEAALGGFGPIIEAAGDLRGEDGSWAATVRRRIEHLAPVADAGLVAPGLLDRAEAAVLARPGVLTTPHGGRLLHGDFHPRHVYARNGRVTAIIDWGDAMSGNPVFDIARVLHSATAEQDLGYGYGVLRRFLDSYGEAPWLDSDLTESLLVHAVVFILWAMRCELAGGSPWPPWWPAQSAALTAVVDELGRP